MTVQQRLFKLQSSDCILPLSANDGEFRFGNFHVSTSDVFISLRLLRALDGCGFLSGQLGLPAVGRLALRQDCRGAEDSRFGLGLIGSVRRHSGLGTREPRLLLILIQRG